MKKLLFSFILFFSTVCFSQNLYSLNTITPFSPKEHYLGPWHKQQTTQKKISLNVGIEADKLQEWLKTCKELNINYVPSFDLAIHRLNIVEDFSKKVKTIFMSKEFKGDHRFVRNCYQLSYWEQLYPIKDTFLKEYCLETLNDEIKDNLDKYQSIDSITKSSPPWYEVVYTFLINFFSLKYPHLFVQFYHANLLEKDTPAVNQLQKIINKLRSINNNLDEAEKHINRSTNKMFSAPYGQRGNSNADKVNHDIRRGTINDTIKIAKNLIKEVVSL